MKVFIIGGTGLISTTTSHLLAEAGHQVTLYNRRQSIYPAPANVKVIQGDRTHYALFEAQAAEAGKFDVVIDMIGYQPEDGFSDIRAFKGKTGQFIFCSTVDVYQKPASRYPYTEDEPYGGLNDYSRKKVILEKVLKDAAEAGAFPLTIIRPAYTYGEGRGPLHPFSPRSYIDRLRKGRPILVPGDGTSLWTSCDQGDVGRAFAAAVGNLATFGQSYHAAGEEWLTWDQYHQQAAEAIGAPEPQLVHIPSELLASAAGVTICVENFQYCNIFDNAKAHRDLNFQYTLSWKQGVQRMTRWLDDHGQVADCADEPLEDRILAAWEKSCKTMSADLS